MSKVLLKFKKLNDDAKDPIRSSTTAAGYDLFCTEVKSGPNYIEYSTGLAFEIPLGYVGLLFPRSSVSNKDLMLANAVGVIDSDYRGPVSARFKIVPNKGISLDENNKAAKFNQNGYADDIYAVGDKCVQLVVLQVPEIELKQVEELSDTQRGAGGYGSTGK
jgi:dUTP pyrophosphatase